jgi:hypothetical protein
VNASVRWLADENFNNDIVRALLRSHPKLDIVRAQDAGLGGVSDPQVLSWAAAANRLVLTHDVRTMTAHAYARAAAGETMPGIFEVSRSVPIAAAGEDILLISECSVASEWEGQVRYLPLR